MENQDLPYEELPPALIRSQDSGFNYSITSSLDSSIYSLESNAERTLRIRKSVLESQKNKSQETNTTPPIAEIELCSLLNREKLPLYRLRVDPSTAFLGYKHKDFRAASKSVNKTSSAQLTRSVLDGNVVEVEKEGEEEEEESISVDVLSECTLDDEEIESCFSYFLLCGLRVSQMSQTYEDIEAVTHLLEEKQNDLELAAKIGRKLLDQKQELERRLGQMEMELKESTETVQQLRYQLSFKETILQDVSRDLEMNQAQFADDDDATSISSIGFNSYQSDSGAFLSNSSARIDKLQRKIHELQDENVVLQQERSRLNRMTDQLDDQETNLVRDCAGRLSNAETVSRRLQDELQRKADDYMNLHFKYTQSLNRICELETGLKQAHHETEMMRSQLSEWQTKNQVMASKYCDYRDKYDECLTILAETQRELRKRRKELRSLHRRLGPLEEDFDSDNSPKTACANSLARELHQTALRDSHGDSFEKVSRAMHNVRITKTATMEDKNPVLDDRLRNRRQSVLSDYHKVAITFGMHDSDESSSSDPIQSAQPRNAKSKNPSPRLRKHSMPAKNTDIHRPKSVDLTGKFLPISGSSDHLSFTHQASQLYEESYKNLSLPQRLQLVKQIDGSQVLERWQQLAAPSSLVNALFEEPLHGIAARGISNRFPCTRGKSEENSTAQEVQITRQSRNIAFADPPSNVAARSYRKSESNAIQPRRLGPSILNQIRDWGFTAAASALSVENLSSDRDAVHGGGNFSLGALMMSIVPEQFWPFVPPEENDVQDSEIQVAPNSSSSGGSLPDRFNCVSASSTGLLEAGVLLTGSRIKGASLRKTNEIVVEQLAAEEASQSEKTSLNDDCDCDLSIGSSVTSSSSSLDPASLISQLVSAPPIAKMRSPRAVYRPADTLRSLVEEEDSNSTTSSEPLQLAPPPPSNHN